MNPSPLIMPNILQRYREMLAALEEERGDWADPFWLRIAAQVATTKGGSPASIADAIRLTAICLDSLAEWFREFASPARFVIAALLVQHDVPMRDFVIWRLRTKDALDDVGLSCDPFALTMTALILHQAPGHRPVGLHDAHRLKELHDRLKRLHRWLVGAGDIPVFAALTQIHQSPEIIAGRIEEAYQMLLGDGLLPGHDLQTSANLLLLTGLTPLEAVSRFRDLDSTLELFDGPIDTSLYQSIAVLAMLDHDAAHLAQRFLVLHDALAQADADLVGTLSHTIIATDLTALGALQAEVAPAIGQPRPPAELTRALRTFQLASLALLSQVDRGLIQAADADADAAADWPGTP